MDKHKIKVGRRYETKVGNGECVKVGGCFPWAAVVRIDSPHPPFWGEHLLRPRDFVRELPPAATSTTMPTGKQATPARDARTDRLVWHSMYLGAFACLRISNVELAQEMALLTCSDDEAIRVIAIMRDGPAGDRVYPALEHLRSLRKEQVSP